MPIEHKLLVQCKSLLEGDAAERLCRVACTACGKCALDAAPGVIAMTNGLAVVDYAKNDLAGPAARRPGVPAAGGGGTAVVEMEAAASGATAAWGDEGWTAAAVTAGFSLVGLRAAGFASGQGVAAL